MIIFQSIIPQFRTLTTPIKYEGHKEILRKVKNNEYRHEEIVSLIEEFAWHNEKIFDMYESVTKELNHFKDLRWEPNRADAVRNRRRALKQLNKAIKRKNKYIKELEDALHGNENYIHSLEEQLKFVRE